MTIKILLPNGVTLMTLILNQRNSEISQGRRVIIKSIATKYNFLTGVAMRKDSEGNSFIEIRMKPETNAIKVPNLVRDLIQVLL